MLPTFKYILYCLNLGDGTRNVFRLAVQEALKHQAELVFLKIIEPLDKTAAARL